MTPAEIQRDGNIVDTVADLNSEHFILSDGTKITVFGTSDGYLIYSRKTGETVEKKAGDAPEQLANGEKLVAAKLKDTAADAVPV